MHDLGTLPGGKSSVALRITATGQVVGEVDDASGHTHPFVYNGSRMREITLGGTSGTVKDINIKRVIVGSEFNEDFSGSRAFLFDGATTRDSAASGAPLRLPARSMTTGSWWAPKP